MKLGNKKITRENVSKRVLSRSHTPDRFTADRDSKTILSNKTKGPRGLNEDLLDHSVLRIG